MKWRTDNKELVEAVRTMETPVARKLLRDHSIPGGWAKATAEDCANALMRAVLDGRVPETAVLRESAGETQKEQ